MQQTMYLKAEAYYNVGEQWLYMTNSND
jgi:hypothetical protein